MSKIAQLKPGIHYSNEDICEIFLCAPQGGMRRSKRTNTLTLIADHTKSIYDDRWKNQNWFHDGVLNYTGMGRQGNQVLDGNQNITLFESDNNGIEVHLFEVLRPRIYTYKGQVQLADKPFFEKQNDVDGWPRDVWIFPLKILANPSTASFPKTDEIKEDKLTITKLKESEVEKVSKNRLNPDHILALESISIEFFVKNFMDLETRTKNSILWGLNNNKLVDFNNLYDLCIASSFEKKCLFSLPSFGQSSLINLNDCLNKIIVDGSLIKRFSHMSNKSSKAINESNLTSINDINSIEEMLNFEISILKNIKHKEIIKYRHLTKEKFTLKELGEKIGVNSARIGLTDKYILKNISGSILFKYYKEEIFIRFKQDLNEFFFSKNSFISYETAKSILKSESEPTSIKLFVKVLYESLEKFLHENYVYSKDYKGWFIDVIQYNESTGENYVVGLDLLDLQEAFIRAHWPIKLSEMANLMNLPEPVVKDKVLLSKKFFIKEIEGKDFIYKENLTLDETVRFILRRYAKPLTLKEVQDNCLEMFDKKVSIGRVNTALAGLPDGLPVDRGIYALYENIYLEEEQLDNIKEFSENYLLERQKYVSAIIICQEINRKQNLEKYGFLENEYVLYGICQDDKRFIYNRGLMLGLNREDFHGKFISLTQEIKKIMDKEGRPLTTDEILDKLSSTRSLHASSVSSMLNNDSHGIFQKRGNTFFLSQDKSHLKINEEELMELDFDDF